MEIHIMYNLMLSRSTFKKVKKVMNEIYLNILLNPVSILKISLQYVVSIKSINQLYTFSY